MKINTAKKKFGSPYGPGCAKSPVEGGGLLAVAKPAVSVTEAVTLPHGTTPISFTGLLISEGFEYITLSIGSAAINADGDLLITPEGGLEKDSPPSAWRQHGKEVGINLGRSYERFGEHYGLTPEEVQALYVANDQGLSFAQLADLLERAPVPHTSEFTATRVADAAALVNEAAGAVQAGLTAATVALSIGCDCTNCKIAKAMLMQGNV